MSSFDHRYTKVHRGPNRRYGSCNWLLAGFTLLASLAFLSLLYTQGHPSTRLLHRRGGDDDLESEEATQSQTESSKNDLDESAQSILKAVAPTLLSTLQSNNNDGRLIIIGDVHGCDEELEALLDKVQATGSEQDHVIFVGDLVAKGDHSKLVVEKARSLGASCVRGNHDQRVLLSQYAQAHDLPHEELNDHLPEGLDMKSTHIELAKTLSEDDLAYLTACPAMLKLPEPYNALVAHAGIDPSKSLDDQDPSVVMTVRNILDDGSPSASKDEGMAWAEVWDEYQKNNGNPAEDDTEKSETKMSTASTPDHQGIKSIVYGHDAGRGLKVRKYAYGLDSGCVYGKSLTALVLPGWEIVSVPCKEHSSK